MTDNQALYEAVRAVDRPLIIREHDDRWTLGDDAPVSLDARKAFVPACRLEDLGDASFLADHRLRYAYAAGAMANGIGSVEIVEAMSRAGMIGFFGAAGLPLARVETAIERLSRSLGDAPHGYNLIHSPNEPDHENAVVDLYLRRGVRLVEASAYLDLTLPLIRYRTHGIHGGPSAPRLAGDSRSESPTLERGPSAPRLAGDSRSESPTLGVVTPNRIIAKVSRVEVASKFFAPPPARMLQELVRTGGLTPEQARLAARIPVAQDLTAEADSGGHTDNRPLVTLLPTMLALRDRIQAQYRYDVPLRVGAAGGIATPASVAAAFVMGAAYVLTGSVNQACVESGSSDAVREMLAQAEQADVIMAPAADMFEMGVKLQVLKRGTMFAMRAAKLYELYRTHPRLEDLSIAERTALEKNLFRAPLEEIWAQTRVYFLERDPRQVERAEREPKHRMALVFRWYLGQSSRWANAGEPTRKLDYQVWCGPAMGAFNEWTKGLFLEQARKRRVVTVAHNLLHGAAVLMRLNMLRCQGVPLDPEWSRLAPFEV